MFLAFVFPLSGTVPVKYLSRAYYSLGFGAIMMKK